MIRSRQRARLVAILTSTALGAAALASGGAGAATGDEPSPKGAVASRTSASTPAKTYASGVILRTSDGTVSSTLLKKADSLTARSITRTRSTIGRAKVLQFDRPVPLADAQRTVAALVKRADVVSAEPDVIVRVAANPPVTANDPYFSTKKQQYGVWDYRSTFQGVTLPAGGYSVKAPSLWRATKGSSTVKVAMIDTGITTHPDLAGEMSGGYDFYSDVVTDRDTAKGRDADPKDPGDWSSDAYCGFGTSTDQYDSSWHGTHVAGIIAAKANNKVGIAGIASGARVEPIRAVGPCGGSTSDIADAIVWAAGGHIVGVRDNTGPAKVINLSLESSTQCDDTFQEAIDTARHLGAVVVAAAGNESDKYSFFPIGSPANCAGVVAVVASDEVGQVALYSSIGSKDRPATISAPGGNQAYVGFSGIVSTINTGKTTPTSSGYTQYEGTSMASPAVAAGAALLSSLGYTRSEIEVTLKHAVQSFPQYGDDFDCDTTACGAGILDLSKVPAPYAVSISGTMKSGKTLTATKSWTVSPTSYGYRWYRNGSSITSATKSTYKLTSADRKKKITVKVSGAKKYFKTLSRTSAARTAS